MVYDRSSIRNRLCNQVAHRSFYTELDLYVLFEIPLLDEICMAIVNSGGSLVFNTSCNESAPTVVNIVVKEL